MSEDIRICFIGDSFVNGVGDETALGWSGRLCATANTHGIPVTYYNLGIRRNTSKDILLRWEKECSLRLSNLCDGRIVISCGVNDTVIENGRLRVRFEESVKNIRKILEGAKKYNVIMVGPPPIVDNSQNERIKAISEAYEYEANLLNVPFIELYSSLIMDNAYKREISKNDGAHPKSNGYLKIAGIIGLSPNWWFNEPESMG